MIEDSLLAPMFESEREISNPALSYFINYINVLEGVKTRIKNLHWAANRLPIRDKRGAHLYLDEFLEVVQDFQDTIAESSQGILGDMDLDAIQGTRFSVKCPCELMTYIEAKTRAFYDNMPSSSVYAGIKSETETFIVNIDKYTYLFNLTK